VLDIIGFRTNYILNNTGLSDDVHNQKMMRNRFFAYICFFLLTIYLDFYFKQQIAMTKHDESFSEEDYKKLFDYKRGKFVRKRAQNYDIEIEGSANLFRKKDEYYREDLIDFYERKRFTLPFMVYRAMKWWKIFDFIA
jgi:hypothetical protein